MAHDTWPALPLDEWSDTYRTLHLWTQIVGKTRLALAPMENHWWNTTLNVTSRGLGTSAMPAGDRNVDIEFDFIDHVLIVRTSDGETAKLPLVAQSVADFFDQYMHLLHSLGIQPHIWQVPQEVPERTRFSEDTRNRSYDSDAARRSWLAFVQADRLLKQFRGNFLGKCSPSQLFWGSFDIACTRFSGRKAPVHPGGNPYMSDAVNREAYSHECISAGWWPGTIEGPVKEPAFYAYAYPEPPGCTDATIQPANAYYHPVMHIWVLPYESIRTADDRDARVLEFFESTYSVAADLGGWDRKALERT